MAEYALTSVLRYHRDFDLYEAQQRVAGWHLRLPRPAAATHVGVMGLGDSAALPPRSWRRPWLPRARLEPQPRSASAASPASPARSSWPPSSRRLDILVCLLPLTAETEGILERDLFGPAAARRAAGQCRPRPPSGRGRPAGRSRRPASSRTPRSTSSGAGAAAGGPPLLAPSRGSRITPHSASYSLPASGADCVRGNLRRAAGRPPAAPRRRPAAAATERRREAA